MKLLSLSVLSVLLLTGCVNKRSHYEIRLFMEPGSNIATGYFVIGDEHHDVTIKLQQGKVVCYE